MGGNDSISFAPLPSLTAVPYDMEKAQTLQSSKCSEFLKGKNLHFFGKKDCGGARLSLCSVINAVGVLNSSYGIHSMTIWNGVTIHTSALLRTAKLLITKLKDVVCWQMISQCDTKVLHLVQITLFPLRQNCLNNLKINLVKLYFFAKITHFLSILSLKLLMVYLYKSSRKRETKWEECRPRNQKLNYSLFFQGTLPPTDAHASSLICWTWHKCLTQ